MAPVPDPTGSTPDADAVAPSGATASPRGGRRATASPRGGRATASPRRARVDVRILILVFGGAAVLYALDQGVKAAIVGGLRLGEVVPVLGEILQLHYVTNSGAAFSSFSGFTWVLTLIAIGVIVFIVWFARRIHSIGWAFVFALILGGALGNATDRFVRTPGGGQGHVVDYIQVWGFPAIFNIADIAVCVAMGLFLLLTLRGIRLDGTRATTAPRRPAEADSDAEAGTRADARAADDEG